MSSYPPPPALLPPAYLPLPEGQLGPSNPYPYPNFRSFEHGKGQFHAAQITAANRAVQYGPPLQRITPAPSAGPMFWSNKQFEPQKWVTTYAAPEMGDCGCGGSKTYGCDCGSYGGLTETWEAVPVYGKIAVAGLAAFALLKVFSKP